MLDETLDTMDINMGDYWFTSKNNKRAQAIEWAMRHDQELIQIAWKHQTTLIVKSKGKKLCYIYPDGRIVGA